MYTAKNLRFPNYNKQTETNDGLGERNKILVYEDIKHTIYIEISNAAPFQVCLIDTFHDRDYAVIGTVDGKNLQEQLIGYLGQ
jgi:hypothetical protein